MPLIRRRGLGVEAHAVLHAGLLRALAGRLDRAEVVVGAREQRLRERLGHQDRRGAVAAAHVGDARPALELVDDAVQRRQPLADQVRVVAGAEEALATVVDVVDVLVPADALAGAGRVGDARRVQHGADRELEEAGQVRRAVGVGERDGLLGRQRVAAAVGVIGDVAAGRLHVQPLADVALRGAGALGQLDRREPAGAGQRAVEPELVAHDDERSAERGAHLVDCAEHELREFVSVELDGRIDRGHRGLLGLGSGEATVAAAAFSSGPHLVDA